MPKTPNHQIPIFTNYITIKIFNPLNIDLGKNFVVIGCYGELAPNHVHRILTLAKQGFYNGIKFHRVIKDFMAQCGCPYGNGMGSSKLPNLIQEFNHMHHDEGVVSMARSNRPDSANSQFFIMLGEAPHLDQNYTVWGKVISGMQIIKSLPIGDIQNNGQVKNPANILEMYESDIDGNRIHTHELNNITTNDATY